MFLILTLYALFASTFIIGKEAVMHVPPIFFVAIRMLLSGALLLGFVRIFKHEAIQIKKEEIKWFVPIILFHIYLSFVLEYTGLQYLSAAKTCLLYSLSPFITALFAYWAFNETMTPKKWLGLIIGFLGFLPVMLAQAPAVENALGHFGPFSIPELMLIISVTSASVGWIAMQKLTKDFGHSYFFVNSVGMFGGGILAAITSLLSETMPTMQTLLQPPFWMSLGLLILIGNVICFNLYGHLLHKYSTTILSFFGFITPLFAALFDWVWFGQAVSYAFYITLVLVSIGLYLFYQEELKQGYIG